MKIIEKAKENYLILIWSVLIIAVGVFFILHYEIFFVDEVNTFSMANSQTGGFVYSSGRVGKYLEEKVFADSIMETVESLFGVAKDVIINRGRSDFFQMDPPAETRWYTPDEIEKIFRTGSGERFDYLNVLKNSLSDESNPFLYYALIHTVSSLFPYDLSYSKWVGGIVNLLFFIGIVFLVYIMVIGLDRSRTSAAFIAAFASTSTGLISRVPYCRAYVASNFFILLICFFHILIYGSMKKAESIVLHRKLVGLSITIILGFYTHYSTTIYAGTVFFVFWLICLFKKMPGKLVMSYVRCLILSGIVCVFTWPVSVFGMLKKFIEEKTGKGKLDLSILMKMLFTLFSYVNSRRVLVFIFMILFGLAVVAVFLKKQEDDHIVGCSVFMVLTVFISGTVITMFLDIRYTVMLSALFSTGLALLFCGCLKEKIFVPALSALIILNLVVAVQAGNGKDNGAYYYYKEIAEKHEGETALFVRHYKMNYEVAPQLSYYGRSLVITRPNVELDEYTDDEKLEGDRLIVYVYNDDEAINEVRHFVTKKLGYGSFRDLFENNEEKIVTMRVFEAERSR